MTDERDREAFRALYREHHPTIRGYITGEAEHTLRLADFPGAKRTVGKPSDDSVAEKGR